MTTHLCNEHVAVQEAVELVHGALHAHQTMLLCHMTDGCITSRAACLGVVEPVSGAPSADQPLYLVGLEPHKLVTAPITPLLQSIYFIKQRTVVINLNVPRTALAQAPWPARSPTGTEDLRPAPCLTTNMDTGQNISSL